MEFLPIAMIVVSFINMCFALYMKDIQVAMWSFNAMVWAALYLTK